MLRERLLVSLLLVPVAVAAMFAGGLWIGLLALLMFGQAAREYAMFFRPNDRRPSALLVVGGVLAIVVGRYLTGFEADVWLLPLLVMISMTHAVLQYEDGRDQAGTELALNLAGMFYIGLLGSFMLSLRLMEQGEWWLLLTLPAVWWADSAAYYFGVRFGRSKISKRVSPNKTWVGYISGVVAAVLGTLLLLSLYRRLGLPAVPAFSPANAAWLGLALGALPTLGDFGVSMLKRQMGVKDAGNLLPGHGGVLDRIDSWLWAFPISYFLIQWVFLV